MSLTKQDLAEIRKVVLDVLEVAVEPRLDMLEGGMGRLEGRMEGAISPSRARRHYTATLR